MPNTTKLVSRLALARRIRRRVRDEGVLRLPRKALHTFLEGGTLEALGRELHVLGPHDQLADDGPMLNRRLRTDSVVARLMRGMVDFDAGAITTSEVDAIIRRANRDQRVLAEPQRRATASLAEKELRFLIARSIGVQDPKAAAAVERLLEEDDGLGD